MFQSTNSFFVGIYVGSFLFRLPATFWAPPWSAHRWKQGPLCLWDDCRLHLWPWLLACGQQIHSVYAFRKLESFCPSVWRYFQFQSCLSLWSQACISNSNLLPPEAPCQPVGEDVEELPGGPHVIPVNTSCQDGWVWDGPLREALHLVLCSTSTLSLSWWLSLEVTHCHTHRECEVPKVQLTFLTF